MFITREILGNNIFFTILYFSSKDYLNVKF